MTNSYRLSRYTWFSYTGIFLIIIGLLSFITAMNAAKEEYWLYPHMPIIGGFMFFGGLIELSLLGMIQFVAVYPTFRTEKKYVEKLSFIIMYLAVIFFSSSAITALCFLPEKFLYDGTITISIHQDILGWSLVGGTLACAVAGILAVFLLTQPKVQEMMRRFF